MAKSTTSEAVWWRRMGTEAWDWTREAGTTLSQDLQGLFEVRRVDDAAALLISPEQALRFREGLQQRTLTAQLALMMHQSKIWQSELERVAMAVDGRFDMRSQQSREARDLARGLLDTAIETQLPTVDNSLTAIAAARDAVSAHEAPDMGSEPADSNTKTPDGPDHPAAPPPSPKDADHASSGTL